MGLQLRVTTFLIPLYWRKINDREGGEVILSRGFRSDWIWAQKKFSKLADYQASFVGSITAIRSTSLRVILNSLPLRKHCVDSIFTQQN